jgi:hypothetical protein
MKFDFARQPLWARRALFVGGNLVALAVVYLLFVAPIQDFFGERAEGLAERQTTLGRYSSVSGQEDAVLAYAKQVADSNTRGELVAGASAGIVDANLQAQLKALSEQAGVTVRSIQTLPTKTVRGAVLVGARIDVSGPIGPLHALTRALEGETPLLLIFAASVRGQANFWGITPADGNQVEPVLEAQFDVYGGSLAKDHP